MRHFHQVKRVNVILNTYSEEYHKAGVNSSWVFTGPSEIAIYTNKPEVWQGEWMMRLMALRDELNQAIVEFNKVLQENIVQPEFIPGIETIRLFEKDT